MKSHHAVIVAAWTVGLAGGLGDRGARAWADPTTIAIQRGVAQLFVDDFLIDSQSNLKRTLHQPRKDDGGQVPMIAAKDNSGLLAYGTIVVDTKLKRHVMFAQDYPSRHMLRATSADGLTWDRVRHEDLTELKFDTDLGALPPDAKGTFGIDLFSCFYDAKDAQYPYKGWLWLANCGFAWEGAWYVRSADGLAWERVRQILSGYAAAGDPSCRVITQAGRTIYGPGDVTLFYHDAVADRFLGIFKFYNPFDVSPGYSSRCRAYAFMDRIDEPFDTNRITHIELLGAMAEKNGDTPYDEYYASTAWRYESLWLGGLKVFHGQGDYPYSANGCAFLKLVVSRDGLHWKKVPFLNDSGVPEVFIPNGPEGGNNGRNDGGYMSEFSQGPLRVGHELVYYYSASSWGKNQPSDKRIRGGGIFRARLRLDGFVSVDWGTLTTRLLACDGDQLTINGVGPITVHVLDRIGNPLAAATVTGDSLSHSVVFAERSLRQVASNGVVRLQFTVEPSGKLYSFTVR